MANGTGNASLTQIQEYFGFESTTDFRKEWTALGQDDKDEVKRLVGEQVNK